MQCSESQCCVAARHDADLFIRGPNCDFQQVGRETFQLARLALGSAEARGLAVVLPYVRAQMLVGRLVTARAPSRQSSQDMRQPCV